MSRQKFIFALAASVVMLFSAGWLHGTLINRWGTPANMSSAGDLVRTLPDSFGEWEMRDSKELAPEVQEILQCAGSFHRIYVNRATGDAVSIAFLVGPGGPTAVHVPEICFSTQSYKQLGDSYSLPVESADGTKHSFRGVDFKSNDLAGTRLDVCYGWTTEGVWVAPEQRRLKLAGEPVLFKVQLSATRDGYGTEEQTDTRVDFLNLFIPFVDKHVFEKLKEEA